MSCVAGHQPNLYPYGGFFAKIMSVNKFVIVDNTQYVKKQYQNRNRIQLHDGTVKWLSIPVKNAGKYKQKINEVEIDSSSNWQRKHAKTLLVNYKKAECFQEFFPELEKLYRLEWHLLADFNIAFIKLCLDFLNIQIPVVIASELNISGVATTLILDICMNTGSNTYLHGFHSRDYVDFDLLSKAGIKNKIQDFQGLEYLQNGAIFEPNLSILDLLFHCGKRTKNILLQSQKIVELSNNL
jgi:WbqC-like protein